MSSDSDEVNGETFHVEVIMAARVVETTKKRKRGKKTQTFDWEYEVKWAGYDEELNTWEPIAHLGPGCNELLTRFWKDVGVDNGDYYDGYVCRPSKAWIEKEKKKYWADYEREKKRKRSPGSSKLPEAEEVEEAVIEPASIPEIKVKSKKKTKASSSATKIAPTDESDSEDSEPLSKKRKRSGTPKVAKLKKKAERASKSKSKSQEVASSTSRDTSAVPLPPLPTKAKLKKKQAVVSESPPSPPPPPPPAATAPVSSLFSEDEDDDNAGQQLPPAATVASVSAPAPPDLPPPVHARPSVASRPTKDPSQIFLKAGPARVQPSQVPSSGIDTKKRLGRDALQPVAPQKMAPVTSHPRPPQPDRIITGSSTVMSTGFRSTIQTPVTARPREPEQTLASLNSRETPPPTSAGPGDFSEMPQPVEASSSELASKEDPFHISPSHDNEMQIDLPPQATFAKDADDFLASIEIPVPSKTPALSGPPLPPKRIQIKKKWSWEGTLIAALGGQDTESDVEFKITMTDETVLEATGFTFAIALGKEQELQLGKLYNTVDLDIVLQACQPPAYRCHMELQKTSTNSTDWTTLVGYMSRRQQVALIPFYLDNNLLGHFLLHPSTTDPLKSKQLTAGLGETTLIAWLLPWTLTPEHLAREPVLIEDAAHDRWFSTLSPEYNKVKSLFLKDVNHWNKMVKTRPFLQYALRTVGMPGELYKYLLESSSRTWSIMPPRETVKNGLGDLEGQLLTRILKKIEQDGEKQKIRQAGKGTIAGMMFIHVGALCQLQSYQYFLRALLQTSTYTRFYTYGTHPKVPSSFWGVREIYPYGGVLTLTPSAFLQHPLQVTRKLKALAENPTWVVYILPSVLGMIASILNVTEVAKFPFPYLLKAISQGEVAMMQAPPDTSSWYGRNDQRQTWLRNYIQGRPLKPEEALSQGIAAFNSKYANSRQSDWEGLVEKEVDADLKRMQYQPSLVMNYRRFVVLSGTKLPREQESSIEWMLPGDFVFRDNFPS
ncbi:hypothetical protein BKA70DRAFT_1417948 [Coprinopsis sp. MPI-PUGE-AT-0042]|nr:hypothetical protein BKA70DRAFT_1417948 [Coprinopsis sp. MPI-PUGE-AT-0042]